MASEDGEDLARGNDLERQRPARPLRAVRRPPVGRRPRRGPPEGIGGGALLLFALLLVPALFSLAPGRYTDYGYSVNYVAPPEPAPYPLNCSFFQNDPATCAVTDNLPLSAREPVLLGIIRKNTPEENLDWVRFWDSRLPVGSYYENISDAWAFPDSDGAWGENGSLRNVWFRLLDLYPAVLDEKDNAYYLPDQALANVPVRIHMVVPTPDLGDASLCGQNYHVQGYDYELVKRVGAFTTRGSILPIRQILEPGQKANLTIALDVEARYDRNFSRWVNQSTCDAQGYCNITPVCRPAESDSKADRLHLERNVTIKRYPVLLSIDHHLAVPKSGFAKGVVRLLLPNDFLYYQITIKGQSFRVRKNEVKLVRRGERLPILDMHLIPAPSAGGPLHVLSINESVDGTMYWAEIKYKLLIDRPDIGLSDCGFTLVTPFETKSVEGSCDMARAIPSLRVNLANATGSNAILMASVSDQLGNRLEGVEVEFGGYGLPLRRKTDENGQVNATVPLRESTQTVVATVVGSEEVASASATLFVPGKGANAPGAKGLVGAVVDAAPMLLLLAAIAGAMAWMGRRRSGAWGLAALLLLSALIGLSWGAGEANTTSSFDVQATLNSCKNYDFDNAVRHFGECAEAFRLAAEFSSMRRTASVLVANIAPLVVATPDVGPYQGAYANMVLIALSLFRVAWAFNSLYLMLNIFNPVKRSEALKQYVWLIVFVIFVYASFSLIRESIGLVNAVSGWVAGPDAAGTLTQATQSAEFVAENYEMLRMVMPFLHLTYLILLARYITMIGMVLFFPFSLLLFFTGATRGYGQATLTVTFAAMGLGVINAILLLIYGILTRTTDPALTGSFATTFFSASFIVFFGFVNILVLSVAFLSGIVFIGQNRSVAL